MRVTDLIPVARGEQPADLLMRNARVINVFSGEVEQTNVAIFRKRIAGLGDYQEGKEVIDLEGRFLVPGLINAHVHIESTMLEPREFARAVLPRGTTTVIADPHEIANVVGLKGLDFFLRYTEGIPLNIYFMIPSCVPATRFETNGATINVMDMIGFIEKHPRVLGLGEVMNYPGILQRDHELITMIELFRHKYKKIDGHAPGLSGKDLNAYISAFIRSDHESTTAQEAREKLSRGMQVLMRYGTGERDLENLLPVVSPITQPFFSFCTDDKHPEDIVNGDIDEMVRITISHDIDPVTAIRIASINTARHYGLRSMGAIAPGYKADMLVVEDLYDFRPLTVYKDGKVVASNGKCTADFPPALVTLDRVMNTISCSEMEEQDFRFHLEGTNARVRAINMMEGSVLTGEQEFTLAVHEGQPDLTGQDIAKICVLNRYDPGKQFSLGFVSGTGMERGALALSVGHDSHNISITGKDDRDMALAANEVIRMGGGMVVTLEGQVLASLPLPVAGLMSDKPLDEVLAENRKVQRATKELGCTLYNPMMALSFVQLEVIPHLKLTNKGLMNIDRFEFVDPVIETW
ncbi:MAG TPA: adenine deaminase [Thermotogota bacterium]|nr:adenine deaminase [Thermotogota bacterium]HRW92077.1 adenine deaminase [Thermotogota bacterium]